MKKIILLPLILVFITQLAAQNEEYRLNAGVSLNYTFTGDIINSAVNAARNLGEDVKNKTVPSLQLSLDYGLEKWFSIGAAVSYEKLGFVSTGGVYFNETTMQNEPNNYTAEFTRTSIAFRPLFHYANDDKLDLYSGLRIHYFMAEYSDDSKDPNTADVLDLPTKVGMGVSIVPFGMRYYFSDNVGMGTELNLGRPYVVNISVNARF